MSGPTRPPSWPASTSFQVAVDALLQFLRIKGGQGPSELSLRVDPSVDVADFYGSQQTVTVQEVQVPTGIGTGKLGTAATATRRYLAISGAITMGAAAGTRLQLVLGYSNDPAMANFVVLSSQTFTPAIGVTFRTGVSADRIMLPAQYFPFLIVIGDAGGADHVPSLQYSYQRCDGLP